MADHPEDEGKQKASDFFSQGGYLGDAIRNRKKNAPKAPTGLREKAEEQSMGEKLGYGLGRRINEALHHGITSATGIDTKGIQRDLQGGKSGSTSSPRASAAPRVSAVRGGGGGDGVIQAIDLSTKAITAGLDNIIQAEGKIFTSTEGIRKGISSLSDSFNGLSDKADKTNTLLGNIYDVLDAQKFASRGGGKSSISGAGFNSGGPSFGGGGGGNKSILTDLLEAKGIASLSKMLIPALGSAFSTAIAALPLAAMLGAAIYGSKSAINGHGFGGSGMDAAKRLLGGSGGPPMPYGSPWNHEIKPPGSSGQKSSWNELFGIGSANAGEERDRLRNRSSSGLSSSSASPQTVAVEAKQDIVLKANVIRFEGPVEGIGGTGRGGGYGGSGVRGGSSGFGSSGMGGGGMGGSTGSGASRGPSWNGGQGGGEGGGSSGGGSTGGGRGGRGGGYGGGGQGGGASGGGGTSSGIGEGGSYNPGGFGSGPNTFHPQGPGFNSGPSNPNVSGGNPPSGSTGGFNPIGPAPGADGGSPHVGAPGSGSNAPSVGPNGPIIGSPDLGGGGSSGQGGYNTPGGPRGPISTPGAPGSSSGGGNPYGALYAPPTISGAPGSGPFGNMLGPRAARGSQGGSTGPGNFGLGGPNGGGMGGSIGPAGAPPAFTSQQGIPGIQSGASSSGGNGNPILDAIDKAAKGDPKIRETLRNIYASESGHGNHWDKGDSGDSGGPFQMDTAGGRMGAQFEQSHPGMSVHNPKNLQEQADYAADWLRKHPHSDPSKTWFGLQHPERFGNYKGGYDPKDFPEYSNGGKGNIGGSNDPQSGWSPLGKGGGGTGKEGGTTGPGTPQSSGSYDANGKWSGSGKESFLPGREAQFKNVDPRLRDITMAAARHLPPGYSIRMHDSATTQGHVAGSAHHSGRAVDAEIIGPDGKPVPGFKRGESDSTGMYRKFHEYEEGEARSRYPDVHLGHGNQFGRTGRGDSNPDYMHTDLNGPRGNLEPAIEPNKNDLFGKDYEKQQKEMQDNKTSIRPMTTDEEKGPKQDLTPVNPKEGQGADLSKASTDKDKDDSSSKGGNVTVNQNSQQQPEKSSNPEPGANKPSEKDVNKSQSFSDYYYA